MLKEMMSYLFSFLLRILFRFNSVQEAFSSYMIIKEKMIEKNRGDKGGFGPLQSMGSGRIESSFSDLSISSSGAGFRNGSGFGLNSEVYSISIKRKARPPSFAPFPGLKRCTSRRTNQLLESFATSPGLKRCKSRRTNQFLESLKAEGEVIHEDVQPKLGQSRSAAPPLTDPITLTVEEKINVTLKRNGGVSKFDVQGTLSLDSLQILNEEDGNIQLQVQTGENQAISFKYTELFANGSVLGLKNRNWLFPTGQASDTAGVDLLMWRMQSTDVSMVPLAINTDESMVPLTINCWPSTSGNVIGQNETYVSIEYEASSMFDLRNVVISVPLPALQEAPSVKQSDGKWRYDSRNSVLEWSVLLIDNSNRSGSMEFVVPQADSSAFFPISVRFMATETFSDLKVKNIIPLKGGNPPKFSLRTQLITENYQVV